MPKRIVHGERVWGSDKLKAVQHKWMRAEYANLIPLAMANGTFECDPEKIWSLVYSYNRPEITKKKVQQILGEFERVKLLFRFDVDGKPWGFWVNINCGGLLPPQTRIETGHERNGKPIPSEKLYEFLYGQPVASHGSSNGSLGIGMGLGIGIGKGDGSHSDIPDGVLSGSVVVQEFDCAKVKIVPSDPAAQASFAAGYVLNLLEWTGKDARLAYEAQIKKQLDRPNNTKTAEEIAEEMVESWRLYRLASLDFRIKYGIANFFQKGIWCDRSQWGDSDAKRKTDKERNDDAFEESARRDAERARGYSAAPEGHD